MENPYKKDSWLEPDDWRGFRKIPNELFHVLQHMWFSGAEFRVLLTVIDKTLGFGKESDFISYGQFQKMTGLSRQSVNTAIKSLKSKRVIVIKKSTRKNKYMLNLYWDTWEGVIRNYSEKTYHTTYTIVRPRKKRASKKVN